MCQRCRLNRLSGLVSRYVFALLCGVLMSITSTRNLLVALWLCVFSAGAFGSEVLPETEETQPRTQIERFHTALLATARLDGGYDDRVALLGPELDRVFDLPRIARISAGSAWRKLDDPTKNEYLNLLRDVVLGTYVGRFDADRGQTLEVIETIEVKPGRDVVRAQITRPSGTKVALDYYLRNKRIFNVEADGVSDLSIRRTDYSSIIKAEGFAGLLSHLKTQAMKSRDSFVASRQ